MAYKSFVSQRSAKRALKRAKAELLHAKKYEDAAMVRWRDDPTNDLLWSQLRFAENLRKAAQNKLIATMVAYEKQFGLPFAIGHAIRQVMA